MEKEAGLIERKKQGQGRPTKIYVKNFTRAIESSENRDSRMRKYRSLECGNTEVLFSDNQGSGILENSIQEFGKTEGNNTEKKNTDSNNTDLSIHQSKMGRMDVIDGYRERVKEKISYDYLIEQHPYDSDIREIVELIVEVLCTQEEFMRIGKKQVYTSLVQERLNRLDYTHIEYILECMKNSPSNIRNIKAYLLESLFNAPVTIGNYYSAKVNYDFYGSSEG